MSSLCRRILCRVFGARTAPPSRICFTHCGLLTFDLPADLEAFLSRLQRLGGELPRLQVTRKGGKWFALNNTYLAALRELERRGRCPEVALDVVPLTRVPSIVQHGMESACCNSHQEDIRSPLRRGPSIVEMGSVSSVEGTLCPSPRPAPTTPSGWDSDLGSDSDSDSEHCDSDDEASQGCCVCDRYFPSEEQLHWHQERRGHFGCSFCESVFPSLDSLSDHQLCLHRPSPSPPHPRSKPSRFLLFQEEMESLL